MLLFFPYIITCIPDYSLIGNTLTISKNGADATITSTEVNKMAVASIKTVQINEGITEILSGAFSKCSALTKVFLPNSLILMEGCFSGTKITEIYIPSGLEKITMSYMWTFTPLNSISVNSSNNKFSEYKNCLLNKEQTHLYGFVNTQNFELPSTLLSIGTWAFSKKSELKVNIPDSVEKLTTQSFVDSYDCIITFSPNSNLTQIPDSCFFQSMNCDFVLPPKVKKIGVNSFYGSQVKTFSFYPNSSLTSISDKAFSVCGSLTSVRLPKSLTSIAPTAFEGCSALSEIVLEEGSESFYDNGECIASINNKQIVWIHHNVTEFTIGEDVDTIGSSILQTCENLSVLNISPFNSFLNCKDGVIYKNSFQTLLSVIGGLETCEIHKNCTEVPSSFFKGLKKLRSVSFADESVCTKLNDYAFAFCSKLETIKLADSISYIGSCALRNTRLTSIKLPASFSSMYGYHTQNSELKEIIFNENCPMTYIFSNAFLNNAKLSKVILSKRITHIYSDAFSNCNISSIFFPKSIQFIGDNAFAYNYINEITFESESDCSKIAVGAFKSAKIESITFPKNLVTLSALSFAFCNSLKDISFENECQITELVSQVFMSCQSLEKFTIPSKISSIDPIAFYKCFNLMTFEVNDNPKYESIEGVIYEKPERVLVLFPPGKNRSTVSESTVRIANNAFYGCALLESLSFGSSEVTAIGELTFFECINLRSLFIPKTVETIMAGAFEGCSSMTSIEFANESALLSIGASTFSGCGNLTSVKFPDGSLLKSIEKSTFENCVLLSDFKFPSKLYSIGESAFSNCRSLRSALLNSTKIESISSKAFQGCSGITSITLPDSLRRIHEMAFQGVSVEMLYLPNQIEALEIRCFSKCTKLKKVYYCGLNQFENNLAFSDSPDAIVYTLFAYEYPSLDCLPVVKAMERCGVFPTLEFSNDIVQARTTERLFVLAVLAEHDEGRRYREICRPVNFYREEHLGSATLF